MGREAAGAWEKGSAKAQALLLFARGVPAVASGSRPGRRGGAELNGFPPWV